MVTTRKRRKPTKRAFGRLRQLPSGRWQAAYVGPTGQLCRARSTFSAKEDAEGWLATERRKIELGEWGAAPTKRGLTLSAYADDWLAHRNLRERTRSHYRSMLDRLIVPTLGEHKLRAITPAMVREWHTDLGTEHTTRNAHAYSLLHAIMATAVTDELLDANPCRIRAAMQTKRKREIELLDAAELHALADAMPAELRMSVLLAGWCGLRWGETSELRRMDVDRDCATLNVRRAVTYRDKQFVVGEPKTAAGVRSVAIPPHLRDDLADHLAQHVGTRRDALLFADPDTGDHLVEHRYRPAFKAAAAAVDHPTLRVHDLRHVGAVLAAQSGATTAELMHRLGHTTPQMALRYQHVGAGRDAEIAAKLSKLATGL